MKTFKVIGLMSGSSMDGVDIAYCELTLNQNAWSYAIPYAETIPYDEKWRVRLSQLRSQVSLTYVKTDVYYGHYLGQITNNFIKKHNLAPDLIASHGHTIFHYPETRITAQIGDGAAISAVTNLPVVNDFRRIDLANGGQGAPLVGIGDQLLFNDYDYCINLGGFANISGLINQILTAFDIGPCNIPLNRVARDLGQSYDNDGLIASKGTINYDLLQALNNIPFFNQKPPKSLNRDWINQDFWPVVRNFNDINPNDKMKTLVDHIAFQIAQGIHQFDNQNGLNKKVLLSGGSALNPVLVDHIQTHTEAKIIVPEKQIIEYKESLIFALLGILRVHNMTNILGSATGSNINAVGGALHGNFSKLIF